MINLPFKSFNSPSSDSSNSLTVMISSVDDWRSMILPLEALRSIRAASDADFDELDPKSCTWDIYTSP